MEGGLLFFQLIDLPLDPVEKSNRVRADAQWVRNFGMSPEFFERFSKVTRNLPSPIFSM